MKIAKLEVAKFVNGQYLIGPYRLVWLVSKLLPGKRLFGPITISGKPGQGMLSLDD